MNNRPQPITSAPAISLKRIASSRNALPSSRAETGISSYAQGGLSPASLTPVSA